MDSTSASLLHLLRQPDQDAAWQRFVDLYAPLIFHWGRAQGLNAVDTADLVQDVLTLLIVKLPEFQYDPAKRFRGWLKTVTVNQARDHQRRQSVRPAIDGGDAAAQIASANSADPFEEAEYHRFICNRALELMQAEFRDETWQACWKQVVDGQSAAEVAEELELSVNAVYLAKSRVLSRLRDELQDLLD